MATTLTVSLEFALSNTLQKALDLSNPSDALVLNQSYDWVNGVSDNQANLQWHDQQSIALSSSWTVDLAGSLLNSFGDACTFARIKALIVRNNSTQTPVEVKPGTSNGWATWLTGTTPAVVLAPGGLLVLTAPLAAAMAVTAGTGDQLTITNLSGSVAAIVDLILIGADT